MRASSRTSASALVLAASLAAWPALSALTADDAKKPGASRVEPINGSDLKRVVVTKKAAERLDIQTAKVTIDASGGLAVPYAAVLYDVKGKTWIYTNPQPLTYVRHSIVVNSIKGDQALLKEGPAAGTEVVVTGASELYGAESGVGK